MVEGRPVNLEKARSVTFALPIEPFVISVEDTEFGVKVKTPALSIVASPDKTTPAAKLEPLPTKIFPEVKLLENGVNVRALVMSDEVKVIP